MKNINTQLAVARLTIVSQDGENMTVSGRIRNTSGMSLSVVNKTGIPLENNKEYDFHIAIRSTETELWYEAIELAVRSYKSYEKK